MKLQRFEFIAKEIGTNFYMPGSVLEYTEEAARTKFIERLNECWRIATEEETQAYYER